MKEYRYVLNGSSLKLDSTLCVNCGICLEVCPHAVFRRTENQKPVIHDRSLCMECGACAKNCPAEALSVTSGVGCAYAIITGFLKGTEPDCSCGAGSSGCC